MITVENILHKHGLKGTSCRKFIISRMLDSDVAVSEKDIKGGDGDLFDRVTFYRTLRTLEEHEIIHKIVLNDNTVKYALNNHHGKDESLHSHFHCGVCDDVFCMDGKTYFEAELPDNFVRHDVYVVIEGICADCNAH